MKKLFLIGLIVLSVLPVFAQTIDKSQYRDIGDGNDVRYEIEDETLKLGEKITWTAFSPRQVGKKIYSAVPGGSNVSVDKNWKLTNYLTYRFYATITDLAFAYGDAVATFKVELIEEVPKK